MKTGWIGGAQRRPRENRQILPNLGWTDASTFLRRLCLLVCILSLCLPATAAEVASASLELDEAWTGQGVPLIITLYSPGPFSGTASFDLPELPKTAFVKAGNPLVGSKVVDGESYITQRHEFIIYTQQSGEIVIPGFSIRFSGKKTFTSEPEPVKGMTQELRFQSKRPPGTKAMGVVVSVREMKIEQTWQPPQTTEIDAGDVIQRTIERTAEDTTAMMFPSVVASAPQGVRIFDQQPIVEDKTERGESTAFRSDTIKYQFQQAGTFTLPEMTFLWWDPKREELKRQTLPGWTVQVTASDSAPAMASAAESPEDPPTDWTVIAGVFGAIAVVALLIGGLVSKWISHWRFARRRPESIAARKLRAACGSGDAAAAYSALLTWLAAMRRKIGANAVDSALKELQQRELREQLDIISRRLFASERGTTTWDGAELYAAFRELARGLRRRSARMRTSSLPALNPPAASDG